MPTATVASLDCSSGGNRLCKPVGMTLNGQANQVGYVWSASSQNYLAQNLSVLTDPQSRFKLSETGFVVQPADGSSIYKLGQVRHRCLAQRVHAQLRGDRWTEQPDGAEHSHWTQTPPLFDLPLEKQPNFDNHDVTAVRADFAANGVALTASTRIETVSESGFWYVIDGSKTYDVIRSGSSLQVYSIPAS